MKDAVPQINQFLSALGLPLATGEDKYSHWVAPWLYPDRNLAGVRIGWEPNLVHVGPWIQGSTAPQLLDGIETHLGAAAQFESATTPKETGKACAARLSKGEHLGNPIDYSLYLIKKLGDGVEVPNFNLDSDRGYGWHCWDWERHAPADPNKPPPQPVDDFHVYNPSSGSCRYPSHLASTSSSRAPSPSSSKPNGARMTPRPARQAANRYQPNVPLKVRYLDPRSVPDPLRGPVHGADRAGRTAPGGVPEGPQAGQNEP